MLTSCLFPMYLTLKSLTYPSMSSLHGFFYFNPIVDNPSSPTPTTPPTFEDPPSPTPTPPHIEDPPPLTPPHTTTFDPMPPTPPAMPSHPMVTIAKVGIFKP